MVVPVQSTFSLATASHAALSLACLLIGPGCGVDNSGVSEQPLHDAGAPQERVPDAETPRDAVTATEQQPDAPNPMVAAYEALEAADYAALPDLITRLDAAVAADPEAGRLAFYAGTMRLWQSTGGPRQPGEQLDDVLGAIENLERASELGPRDPHAHAFLAIAHVALGNVLRDEERIDTGRRVFDEAIPFYPPYVHGVRTQAFGLLPRDHAYFPDAIESMYETLAACGVDADPADGLDIAYPSASDPPLGTCWNEGIVEHVWEGIFLIYGDVLVKSGDAELGRTLYEAAKLSPTFDTFLFGDELQSRIDDADERAALYVDDDRYNDPPTWMDGQSLCVGCHASKP